jgi:hypothetical protein
MNKLLLRCHLSVFFFFAVAQFGNSQIAVKFKGPAEWTSVYCYVWGPNDYLGVWPGTLMTAETGGWYSISDATLPSGNFIFNNGTGTGAVQTVNQPLTTGDYCIATTGELIGTELNVEMVDCATGIHSRDMAEVNIYPSLVDEILYIGYSKNIKRVMINSVTGVCMLDISKLNDAGSINTSVLKPGIYIVSVSFSDGNKVTSKIVRR